VGAEPIEKALLAFAESVGEHGFQNTGPFASASQLLLRPPPRRRQGAAGPIRASGEQVLEAAKRLCKELDGGVLPIHGPPGCGKTYVGAGAIAELARTKRIGVTAVSHKVIDNLLEEVRKCAAPPLRLVHKSKEEPPQGIEWAKDNPAALAE